MRRYHITERDDYVKYNRVVGQIKKMSTKLKGLDPRDPFHVALTEHFSISCTSLDLLQRRKVSSKQTRSLSALCAEGGFRLCLLD